MKEAFIVYEINVCHQIIEDIFLKIILIYIHRQDTKNTKIYRKVCWEYILVKYTLSETLKTL
jgi:hypothetical protein